jgi:hypothetical protein
VEEQRRVCSGPVLRGDLLCRTIRYLTGRDARRDCVSAAARRPSPEEFIVKSMLFGRKVLGNDRLINAEARADVRAAAFLFMRKWMKAMLTASRAG